MIGPTKNLGLRNIFEQNFRLEKNWVRKNVWPTKTAGKEKCWTEKNLGSDNNIQKNNLV